jgi:uncharacterized protein (TIGR02145 family)
MKIQSFLLVMACGYCFGAFGQRSDLELKFTAIDDEIYLQVDSIRVINRTRGGETVLHYPDTILTLDYEAGIRKVTDRRESLLVFQNYPNPVIDKSIISIFVPGKISICLVITDRSGRVILRNEQLLTKGYHSFSFTPGNEGLCYLSAIGDGQISSIKILSSASGQGSHGSLEYSGGTKASPLLKSSENVRDFIFYPGDDLICVGYKYSLESGILVYPYGSESLTFQFATDIPCPGEATITYEGQVYNTIQVFSQCWLKENLNAGIMINSFCDMHNNDVIEKYCYNNKEDSCSKYGGLYQWSEMMNYNTTQGLQGICPPGWHIPSDEEWKILEGAADSHYGIGDTIWDNQDFRGFDAGMNLKSVTGWNANGNGTDLYGFAGLPGGYRFNDGFFLAGGDYGIWWSSSEVCSYNAYFRNLSCYNPGITRDSFNKEDGFSIRCLKNYQ